MDLSPPTMPSMGEARNGRVRGVWRLPVGKQRVFLATSQMGAKSAKKEESAVKKEEMRWCCRQTR